LARRLGALIVPTILALAGLSILVSLGNWQVRRLAWKEDLIAHANARPEGPVRDLPPASAWPSLDVADGEYRPFRLAGRFLHDKEALVFTSLPDPHGHFGGPGFWVVTPLMLAGGGTVLVNRGFVPQAFSKPADRHESLQNGPLVVTGLMRPDEERNYFTPTDEPEKNIFYARNIAAIAAAKHLSAPVAPFTIDLLASETPPGGLPQAGETRIVFPNSHFQYAVTWYGLAAGLFAAFALHVWRRLRGSVEKSA
jgi:surfeit locus 1 family protein